MTDDAAGSAPAPSSRLFPCTTSERLRKPRLLLPPSAPASDHPPSNELTWLPFPAACQGRWPGHRLATRALPAHPPVRPGARGVSATSGLGADLLDGKIPAPTPVARGWARTTPTETCNPGSGVGGMPAMAPAGEVGEGTQPHATHRALLSDSGTGQSLGSWAVSGDGCLGTPTPLGGPELPTV